MQIPAPQYKRQGEEAECPIRFVMPPGGGILVLWDERKAVGAVGEGVFRRE